jgi:uncharacterized Fe-S cluster-containing radical SAM superfamily protein
MINTDLFSSRLRERSVILSERKVLIARLSGSEQENDLSAPVNCRGYGRIRHFRWYQHPDWSPDPLPILPAAKALGYEPNETLRVQVFQNAACNWRCWYCFVDYSRLSADTRVSAYFTADELIEMYLEQASPPQVIDLSGGQPDLVPEWLLWMIESIKKHGLENKVFLWSDDNLSSRYFWKYLDRKEIRTIAHFPMYSRVACFKGYDEESFSFNTLAAPELFNQQFSIYRDLLQEGLDMYAYVTFTSVPHGNLNKAMERFVDRLQEIHPNLPLRTVPLKVEEFTPTKGRIKQEHKIAMEFQYDVHAAWIEQLTKRFSDIERNLPICDVPIKQ